MKTSMFNLWVKHVGTVNAEELDEGEVHALCPYPAVFPTHRKEEWPQAGSGAALGQGSLQLEHFRNSISLGFNWAAKCLESSTNPAPLHSRAFHSVVSELRHAGVDLLPLIPVLEHLPTEPSIG